MLKFTFGIPIDMRSGGSFDQALVRHLNPDIYSLRSVTSMVITGTGPRGTTLELFGRFDTSSRDAALDSRFTALSVSDSNAVPFLYVSGFPSSTVRQFQDEPVAWRGALVAAMANGFDLRAGKADDLLLGGAGADRLAGGDGNDILRGGAAADALQGNAGNDLLDGGRGADVLNGGSGNDSYVVDVVSDRILEASGGGTDTVRSAVSGTLGTNLECLVLGGSLALSGTGNGLDNRLTGNAGPNRLEGLGGDDSLNGGLGADVLRGGPGNDVYTVERATDRVQELAGQGTDKVYASIDYTLPSNVEALTLTGSAALDGAGNGLANALRGNAADNHLAGNGGADTLLGLGGADTLAGGSGNDTLFGGPGADRFVFAHRGIGNVDSIRDFLAGNDSLWLDPAAFNALGAGVLDATQMRLTTDVADGNDFLVYDPASGRLSYDATGSGGTLFAIADLGAGTALLASDIQVAVPA